MAVKKNKKSISELALEEMAQLKTAIQEESKNTVSTILKEAIKDYIREAEEDEDEFEVVDDETEIEEPDTENTEETENSEVEEPSQETESEVEIDEPEKASDEMEDEGEDEWSELSKYQVDDNAYDFTGAEDHHDVIKVFKLLKDDDNIVVKREGDKITLQDKGADTEYVIELDGNEEFTSEDDSEFMGEGCIKETIENDNEVAGLPDDEMDVENEEDFFIPECVKKSRKTMRENKEIMLEIDLGYTDNYQNEDPIDGLSMTEPSKSGKSWEKGVPTGTEKPWAGETKSKGEPFEKTVNEEENPVNDVEAGQEGMFENTSHQLPNRRQMKKSHTPQTQKAPEVAHVNSTNESIIKKAKAIQKENKELKNALEQLKGALKEAAMTNVNLGQVTKLIIEHTTTREEKVNILNRFHNEAKTIEQSKALYEAISKELKKNVNNINLNENKVVTAKGSEINESVIYKSKELQKTINLMDRMKNL